MKREKRRSRIYEEVGRRWGKERKDEKEPSEEEHLEDFRFVHMKYFIGTTSVTMSTKK